MPPTRRCGRQHTTSRAITHKQSKSKRGGKQRANRTTMKLKKNALQAAAAVCGTSSIDRFYLLLLRGTIVNMTYGTHKKLYV